MRYEFGEHSLDVDRREPYRATGPIAIEPHVFYLIVRYPRQLSTLSNYSSSCRSLGGTCESGYAAAL